MTGAFLPDKVFAFTSERALFSAPCRLIVGVSGGADSMTLLHCLCGWRQQGLELIAVHVHHGLRGENADRDADFVAQQCAMLGITAEVIRTDVAALAEQWACGLEEAGRRERYRVFEEMRQRYRADYIVTAHHADDAAETVLMHLIRGCGTDGLCGIPAARGRIRRPLLCCNRREIEEYCRECGLSYVTDETNTDCSFTRNRIRHEVLPLLRQLNPAVEDALWRLSSHSSEDTAFLRGLASDALDVAREKDGYRIAYFTQQPRPVLRRMIACFFEELHIPTVEQSHIVAVEEALLLGEGGVTLCGGVQVRVSQGLLVAERNILPTEERIVDGFPFSFSVANNRFSLAVSQDRENVHKKFLHYAIDCDTIHGSLRIRSRREGDYLHPAGRGIGKSLKKLMIEWRIPAYLRDTLPLLCDDDGVLLVPGYACDERVHITDATKHFLVWHENTVQG